MKNKNENIQKATLKRAFLLIISLALFAVMAVFAYDYYEVGNTYSTPPPRIL